MVSVCSTGLGWLREERTVQRPWQQASALVVLITALAAGATLVPVDM